jgi:hypothetical protein
MTAQAIVARPTDVPLYIYQGDDFTMTLTVTDASNNPINMTGYQTAAQIRGQPSDSQPLAAFTTSVGGTAHNVITLTLPATQSLNVVGQAYWDCTMTDLTGVTTTLAAGEVHATAEVTR